MYVIRLKQKGQLYDYMINRFPIKDGTKHWKTFVSIYHTMEDKFKITIEYLDKLKKQQKIS